MRKVIQIPSLTGIEGKAQDFLAKYLKALGLRVDLWEPDIEQLFNSMRSQGCVYFSPGLGSVNDTMERIRLYVTKGTESDPWFKDHPVETVFLRHKNTAVISKDEPIVKTVFDCAKAAEGRDPMILGATYGADMEQFVKLGKIPTIIFGPGSIAPAHKPDEFIPIDEYITSIKTLALIIYRWCK